MAVSSITKNGNGTSAVAGTAGVTGNVKINLAWGGTISGSSGKGLAATNTGTSEASAGLYGKQGTGSGASQSAAGVWGDSASHIGVLATSSSGTGLYAFSETGEGGRFGTSGAGVPAVWGRADGAGTGVRGTSSMGSAGEFKIGNTSNDDSCLYASHAGSGPTVRAIATGSGNAGNFSSTGASTVLEVSNSGTGAGARVHITNALSSFPGLQTETAGLGPAAVVEITNASSTNVAALYVNNAGTGWLGSFGSATSNGISISSSSLAGKIALRTSGGENRLVANLKVGADAAPSEAIDVTGNITITGEGYKPGGGSWADLSDVQLKKNIGPIVGALSKLLRLRGVLFEWKEPEAHGGPSGMQMGMVAQEVEPVFPEWIGSDSAGRKTLAFRGFEALTVESLRELKEKADRLRTENEELSARLTVLEGRLRQQ